MEHFNNLYEWAIISLLGVIVYFIRGVHTTFKKLEADFHKFREQYSADKQILHEHERRITKLEDKFE